MDDSTNYQHTAVTGETWLRAKRIVIDNPLGGTPSARFVEERVVNIAGGEQYFRDQGVLETLFTEDALGKEIPMLDPVTGEPSEQTVTYAEAFNLLKSAYIHFADLRDNPPESEPVEDPAADEESEPVEDPAADGEPAPDGGDA